MPDLIVTPYYTYNTGFIWTPETGPVTYNARKGLPKKVKAKLRKGVFVIQRMPIEATNQT